MFVSFDVNCYVAHKVQGKCPPGTTNSTDLLIYNFSFYNLSFRKRKLRFAIGFIPVTFFLIRALFLALGTFSRKSVTFLMVPMTRMMKGSMFELKRVLNFLNFFINSWFSYFPTVYTMSFHQWSFSSQRCHDFHLDINGLKTTISGTHL